MKADDLKNYPDMEDGLTMFFASATKRLPKSEKAARGIAYTRSEPVEKQSKIYYNELDEVTPDTKSKAKAGDFSQYGFFDSNKKDTKFQTDNYYKGFNRVTLPFMEKNEKTEPVMAVKKENNQIITKKMMENFGWPVTNEELNKLNDTLNKYGITDMNSVRLFMATCAHESGFGSASLEKLKKDGTTVGFYAPEERGAGYIQITWSDTHNAFLKSVEDSYSGPDTATYISKNYPWEAAAWFWTSKKQKSIDGMSLNDYVTKYGSTEDIYLITQYYVNGVPKGFTNIRDFIRDGMIDWEISNDKLYVGDYEMRQPNGWSTKNTGRKDTYIKALDSFK